MLSPCVRLRRAKQIKFNLVSSSSSKGEGGEKKEGEGEKLKAVRGPEASARRCNFDGLLWLAASRVGGDGGKAPASLFVA